MTVAALIVAAGRGTRLGAEVPKQYIPLDGVCALRRSVEAFLAMKQVTRVVAVIHADDAARYDGAVADLADARVLPAVLGGETRGRSVHNGLEALEAFAHDKVLIHDAARPFVPTAVIGNVIAALDETVGAFAALPLVDALWREGDGLANAPVARDGLWRAQTPQGFRFDAILAAHRDHDGSGADDVAVARAAGLPVRLVEGSEQNYKITTPADLARALADARRLAPGLRAAE